MSTRLTKVIAVPLALAGALGALGGWLWWLWWGPPPQGKVYEARDGSLVWYPSPFDPGIGRDFSATATYVVLGFALALVLGVVAGIVARHRAIAGVVVVGLASAVAAAVMTFVGMAQSPPDPQESVDQVDVGTELPGHLHVTGWSPYLAWPVGTMLGYLVVMLSLSSVTSEFERPRSPEAT